MMGKSQRVEEGQEKVHVPLQSHLTLQNTKTEALQMLYQGFVHTEKNLHSLMKVSEYS